MPDQPTPTPARKTTPRRAPQDQEIANLISEARKIIEVARDDPEIAPLLAGRGYNTAALAAGLALQQAAQHAFAARQVAMSAQQKAATTAEQALAAAHTTYMDFRETVRSTFDDPDARTALGLTGRVPKDLQKFLTTARSSYATAQSEPYQATLATYGFPAGALTDALDELDALFTANKAQETIGKDAVQATLNRDAAIKALEQWLKKFKSIASIALRPEPTQAKKLGL